MMVAKPPPHYLTLVSPMKALEIQFRLVSTVLLVGTVHLVPSPDFKPYVHFIIIVRRNDRQQFSVRTAHGNKHLDKTIVIHVLMVIYVLKMLLVLNLK